MNRKVKKSETTDYCWAHARRDYADAVKAMKKDNRDVYFSITSYMEINVMEYIDDDDYEGQLSTYVVDDSRLFVELPH